MVFRKKSECNSNGSQIPAIIPRVPRLAKGKRSARKKIIEDNQMCAFDLLATVAGKLLAERDGLWTPSKVAGTTSTVQSTMQEQLDDGIALKDGSFDQGSCNERPFDLPHTSVERDESQATAFLKFDASDSNASCKVFANGEKFQFPSKFSCSSSIKSCVSTVDERAVAPLRANQHASGFLIGKVDEDPNVLCRKPQVIVSSDSSVEFSPYRDCQTIKGNSFPSIMEGMEPHCDRDDAENSSEITHTRYPCPMRFKARCIEYSRKRNMMKSNYRKANPALYNDDDVEEKPVFPPSQRLFYTRQRSQRSSFKKRRVIESSSISTSCVSSHDEDMQSKLATKNEMSDTTRVEKSLFDSEDRPVKLSIKSFRIPELLIEIPANATVGSLKKTVMEAVSSILGDGLSVGIMLRGKKVGDDSKSLRQAGISYDDDDDEADVDKMESLGFILEPNPTQSSPHLHSSLIRHPPASSPFDYDHLKKRFQGATTVVTPPNPITDSINFIESDHENNSIVPSSSSNSQHSSFGDKIDSDSKALVTIPEASMSILPFRKSMPSDAGQRRRIRRPFSVSEVEALVLAVEKLGTGRWRDVKLRAFDSSKHRTYVDLKDKWKTLVHTARISPQQRRGEPVPQDLLNRVLAAHAYWSHQARLPAPAPLLL